MSPASSLFRAILRRLLLRLVLLLDAVQAAREGYLRARLAALPEGHRRRAGLMAELAKAERYRALLADEEAWEDPRFAGLVAEVARVRNDPGRRALARRRVYPRWFWLLPVALPVPAATLCARGGRCTTYMVVS